jgi:hypothetical protein
MFGPLKKELDVEMVVPLSVTLGYVRLSLE